MRLRIATILLAAALASSALAASAGAALIGLYRNDMESDARRGQIGNLSGGRCGRGGSEHAFRILIGKGTSECAYRTPVVGRDLEIGATARLFSSTPKAVKRKAFLAVNLRTGEAGAGYQLAVFPLQRKAQVRKVLSDGRVEYLHIERGLTAVRGSDQPNELRLRAFNVTSGADRGKCRVVAFVGGRQVADLLDPAAGELQGRGSGFSIGAIGNAKGAMGSVDDVVIRVPSPF
ncbi:MAG TPA: hypothetical protein VFU04_06715 [Solirubrobacterales bacterium]|nr:hypothetical protein [Solirubrobacterales bacterium]